MGMDLLHSFTKKRLHRKTQVLKIKLSDLFWQALEGNLLPFTATVDLIPPLIATPGGMQHR